MYILCNNRRYEVEKFVFSGGEVSVKLPDIPECDNIRVVWNAKTSNDVISLLMVSNAIKNSAVLKNTIVDLTLPYVPYARQDRVCNKGEALSIKVMCDLINYCGFNSVTIEDPHSDVTPALINNCIIKSQSDVFKLNIPTINKMFDIDSCILVSPDAGSNKKIQSIAKLLNKDFIRADKVREVSTGQIKETVVYCDDLQGKDCLIVDDLCDGGKTFIELAKVLKQKGACKVGLYVTHGIFSKGKKILIDNGIDFVYAANDWTNI